jgi:hypothetical protein
MKWFRAHRGSTMVIAVALVVLIAFFWIWT